MIRYTFEVSRTSITLAKSKDAYVKWNNIEEPVNYLLYLNSMLLSFFILEHPEHKKTRKHLNVVKFVL